MAIRDDAPREGSVSDYDRDVERIQVEDWIHEIEESDLGGTEDEGIAAAARGRSGGSTPSRRSAGSSVFTGDRVDEDSDFLVAGDAEVRPKGEDAAEPRYLDVNAPIAAPPGVAFPVHAQLAFALPVRATAAPVSLPIPPEGREVTLDLIASRNLEVLTPATAHVLVRRGEDSAIARFELIGNGEGRASIDVRAFADQSFLGAVSVDLDLTAGAPLDQRDHRTTATLEDANRDTLTLEVRLDPDRTQYEFQVRGPDYTGRPIKGHLAREVDMTVQGLQAELNKLARGTPAYSSLAMQEILMGQGAALWEALPEKIRDELQRYLGRVKRLCVLGDDDPFPWELVYVHGPGAPGGFLSDLLLVTRWPYGPAAPLAIGAGPPRYVIPPNPPASASAEVANVKRLLGAGATMSTVDDVITELKRASFGLLHFAAHQKPDFTRPNASQIVLDQPFVLSMVGRQLAGALADRKPLVCVNACSSSVPTLLWVDATSWATSFLRAGAGAFVGSLWEVRDVAAASFANAFYERLKDAPIGQAFQEARRAIRSDGDPTWLAYTLYAHPLAHYRDAPS